VTLKLQDQNNSLELKPLKTKTIKGAGSCAIFGQDFHLPFVSGQDVLHFELFDWNAVTSDEFLGSGNIQLRDIFRGVGASPVQLEGVSSFHSFPL
jgi:hypothetical protein